MPRWLRITLALLALLALLGAGLWRWLDASEPVPATTRYEIDLDALAKLAASLPGAKPHAVRSVLVAEASLPRGVIFAGEPFTPQRQVHQVFQLVWDDRFALIDTAFPPDAMERVGAFGPEPGIYHGESWAQLEGALARADWIVVTHEHFDHLAGAAHVPVARAAQLRLNAAQLANARALEESALPAALRAALQPLSDAPAQALAPGVALLAAPGHTPGSQIVYVERADGRRYLFLGDVAWHSDQIRDLRYRPRHVTYVIGERRAQVLDQFRALHDLAADAPDVLQVVSHDRSQRQALLESGALVEGLLP
jgi:glyoxylase-like metal-dependent hydrolase (beta-lactamase superfamily II)